MILEEDFSNFDYEDAENGIELDQPLREKFDRMFEVLFLYENLRVSVGVDAAARDNSVGNLTLSQQRAAEIEGYLSSLGLESYRMLVVGYGDTRLPEGRNRQSGVTLKFSRNP